MHRRRFLAMLGGTSAIAGCTMQVPQGDTRIDGDDLPEDDPRLAPITADDADGDWLKDEWEEAGEAPNGLPIPEADPDHRDLFVDIVSLSDAPLLSPDMVTDLKRRFSELPVVNPDGKTGINLHVHGPRYLDLSMAELIEQEGQDIHQISLLHGRFLYQKAFMEDRVGIYHLLVNLPASAYIDGKAGISAFKFAMIKTHHREVIMHHLLRTIIGPAFDTECFDEWHTCNGYLTDPPERDFAPETVDYLQHNQFYDVEYLF